MNPPPIPTSPPNIPPQVPFKSGQSEFSDEHNRTVSGLSDAMRTFSNLLKILGGVFAVLLLVAIGYAIWKQQPPAGATEGKLHLGPWGQVLAVLPFALFFLTFGFWAGKAAASFRKIAETKNEDQWHLMNALGSLKNMFATLRFLMYTALVLLLVGAAVVGLGAWLDK